MSQARRVGIVLVVLVGLALAGCTIASQESEYPDEDDVRGQLTSLETLEADVVTESTIGDNVTTTREHVVQDLENGRFRSVVESGVSEGTTVVMDGSTLWFYRPQHDTVQVVRDTPDGDSVDRTIRTVSTIYEQLDDGDADGRVGISPAPTVPEAGADSGPGQGQLTLPIGDNVSVSDRGTGVVDGRDVRIVDLRTTDDRSLLRNATYYIDQEWHLPLKTRVAVQVGNRTNVATVTYTNVSFDEPVDDEQFEFEPPSTASVVEGANGSFDQYHSRDSLVEAVDQSVPDPSHPTGYEFQYAQVSPSASGQTITMIYASESDTVTVSKASGETDGQSDRGEPVEVAGQSGRRVSVGPNDAIVWSCGGNTYSVVGAADGPPLLDVAASVGCS